MTRLLSLVCTFALLAFPAPGLAQSAGDDQYGDPIGGQTGGGSGGGTTGGGTTGGGTTSPTAPAPAPTAPTTPSATTAGTTSGTTTATGTTTEDSGTAPGELPRTGSDPIMVAVFGLAMVLMGLGVRLGVPHRE